MLADLSLAVPSSNTATLGGFGGGGFRGWRQRNFTAYGSVGGGGVGGGGGITLQFGG